MWTHFPLPLTFLLALPLFPPLLIPLLGSRNYRTRERATAALAACGELARPALEDAAQKTSDPEVKARVQKLRAPWWEQVAEDKSRRIKPRNYPRLPWLCGSVVGWAAEAHYLGLARNNLDLGKGAPDWPEYREATRLWVKAQILQRRARRDILDDLDRLAEAEKRWILENGKQYTPPLTLPPGVK